MAGGKKDDVSNKLDELINQYNRSNSGRDAKLAKQSDKKPLSEADRKRLIENGVPIDPELVKQVAGDESAPIVQKPVSHGKKDTVLKTSSGEIIDTKNISDTPVQSSRSDDDIVDDANDSPSRTLSDKYVRREGREIQRILKRARRKYGKERYNRLDPANYTSQKLYEVKRRKLYRRIAIAVAAIIGVAIVGLVIAFILYKRANPTLVYTVNVCSEQDVVDAIKNFLGIHSPSKLFREIGDYMGSGLSIGFDRKVGNLVTSAEDVAAKIDDAMSLPSVSGFVSDGSMDIGTTLATDVADAMQSTPIQLTVNLGNEKLIDQTVQGINDRSFLDNRTVINI